MSFRLLISLMALSLAASCGGAQRSSTQCRPRSEMHCLTPVVCDVDRVLGCEVCRCSDAPFTPIGAPGSAIR